MNIILVSSTITEIQETLDFLNKNGENESASSHHFFYHGHTVSIVITGVGSPAAIFHLCNAIMPEKPDFAIQAGICGSFDTTIKLGTLFQIIQDTWGDLGVELKNEKFENLFDIGLLEKNDHPYVNGWLHATTPAKFSTKFAQAKGITVNKVSGSLNSIQNITEKYQADVETMEGAAFLYVCSQLQIPNIQIRAVSNYIEPRNKENWNIPLAISTLNTFLIEYLTTLIEK